MVSPVDDTPAPDRDQSDSLWLRVSLAFVWLSTGLHALHPYFRAVGGHALDRGQLPHALLWVYAALCVALGALVLARPAGRAPTWLQVALVALVSIGLAAFEPRLLVHPLGALTKNIPFVAAALAAHWLHIGKARWAEHALRLGVSAVWIVEGVFPKMLFQSAWERQFVAEHGFGGLEPGPIVFYVGALEAASGLATLLLPAGPRRWVYRAQALALLALPAWVITSDPSLWLHPLSPLEKNVPILVATLIVARRCCAPERA